MQDSNIFGFDYKETKLQNGDGSDSIWSSIQGEDGKLIHCKKKTYEMIQTDAVSHIARAFQEEGFEVAPYIHRNGEVIGLNVFLGDRMTQVGQKKYNAFIKIPNNGGGRGFLMIREIVAICGNGMVFTKSKQKDKSIKIPHSVDYPAALKLMKEAVTQFMTMVSEIEQNDRFMLEEELTNVDILKKLNKWFYEVEMPLSHKKDMSFNQFRELLVTDPQSIKSIDRYNEVMVALELEKGYNEQLSRGLSMYTVFATLTNYLSRRVEASGSKAAIEIQQERVSRKISEYDLV